MNNNLVKRRERWIKASADLAGVDISLVADTVPDSGPDRYEVTRAYLDTHHVKTPGEPRREAEYFNPQAAAYALLHNLLNPPINLGGSRRPCLPVTVLEASENDTQSGPWQVSVDEEASESPQIVFTCAFEDNHVLEVYVPYSATRLNAQLHIPTIDYAVLCGQQRLAASSTESCDTLAEHYGEK